MGSPPPANARQIKHCGFPTTLDGAARCYFFPSTRFRKP